MKKFLFVLAFLGFIVACSEKVNPDDGSKPQDKDISVTGITLDITDVSIKAGETAVLTPTIMPDNATNKSVKWSSSSNDVATVDNNGKVTGIKEGSATITVTTVDGGKTATCTVTVAAPANGTDNGYEWVDLGLSSGLKWATRNVGATAPEEFGDYFAWGETAPKDNYSWGTYVWRENGRFTKYSLDGDNRTILELEDDAARANWGGSWRVPTDHEWTELRTDCIWTWTTQNGVEGMAVTGPNSKSIFLPAAGGRYDTNLEDAGSYGYYWSSSLCTDYQSSAWYVGLFTDDIYGEYGTRNYGLTVRPVSDEGVKVSVSGVSLDRDAIDMEDGSKATLTASVTPSNATQPAVIWSSSNTSVATVDYSGVVTAVDAGSAIITATTYDGGLNATCSVTVSYSTSYEWVDLGLPSGLKWATCNVGASAPEENGDFFAWGEIEPYYSSLDPLTWKDGKESGYSLSSYKWCNGSFDSFTKYNTKSSYGSVVDNKTILEPADDAARANWGGKWRIPTDAEWKELIDNCIWTWTIQNGVDGDLVTGSNGNSIFLPAAGEWVGAGLNKMGSRGVYWSSSLGTDFPSDAWFSGFDSHYVGRSYGNLRSNGLPIRPVSDAGVKVSVSGISLDQDVLDMIKGTTSILTATVTPSNATQPAVIWSSSNTFVATVDYTGVVTAVNVGSAIITATTYDGGLYATCSVSVSISTNYEWVDLGLPSGLKWATCNVGANAPEDFGDFFAWGEIEPYYVEGHSQDNPCSAWRDGKSGYNWSSYKWCDGSQNTLTKYNTGSSYGIVDNKTKLDMEDDAARANWGGKWRMPTDEDWTELKTNCTWKWNYLNGVGGYFVSGPNGSSIFLPAAGVRGGTGHLLTSSGRYWSSSLPWNGTICALDFIFTESGAAGGLEDRNHGNSIRAVRE